MNYDKGVSLDLELKPSGSSLQANPRLDLGGAPQGRSQDL